MNTQHSHTHTHCFPGSSRKYIRKTSSSSPLSQGEGTCPRSHRAKPDPGFLSQLSLLSPQAHSVPCGTLQAWHPEGTPQLFLCSLLQSQLRRPWLPGHREEGRGHRGRPCSGTCGSRSVRAMPTVSLHRLQPLAVCPHLEREHQANSGTYHLPTHRSLSTPTRFGHLLPPHRHKAHSANPDTVPAFELFAVSGEARRVNRP